MNWKDLIPFVGWIDLDDEQVEVCDLDRGWRWRGLVAEWLGAGFILWAKAYEPR